MGAAQKSASTHENRRVTIAHDKVTTFFFGRTLDASILPRLTTTAPCLSSPQLRGLSTNLRPQNLTAEVDTLHRTSRTNQRPNLHHVTAPFVRERVASSA